MMSFSRRRGSSAATSGIGSLEIWSFALIVWPLAGTSMGLNYLTPYYTEVLGFPLAAFGLMLGAGRLYDVVADICVAYASDNTRGRFGKRKPWVVSGSLLFFAAMWMLFLPGRVNTVASVGFAIFFYFTTWTMAYIPLLTQATELSSSNQIRNKISMTQAWVTQGAIIAGILLPFLLIDARNAGPRMRLGDIIANWHIGIMDGFTRLLRLPAVHGGEAFHRNLMIVTIVMSVVLPLALVLYALFVPSRSERAAAPKASVTAALRNPVFQRFTGGFLLMMCGYMGRTGLFPFIVIDAVRLPDSFLLIYLVQQGTATLITPFWTTLLRRFERSTCVVFAALLEAAGLLLLMITPAGNEPLAIVASVVMGLPGQAILLVPMQIAGDCADFARWKTRKESRAVHVSLLSTMVKLGSVASAGLLWLSAELGFDPLDKAPSEHAVLILKFTGLGIPALCLLAGAVVILRFPLTRRRQEAIRARIDRRSEPAAGVAERSLPVEGKLEPA